MQLVEAGQEQQRAELQQELVEELKRQRRLKDEIQQGVHQRLRALGESLQR